MVGDSLFRFDIGYDTISLRIIAHLRLQRPYIYDQRDQLIVHCIKKLNIENDVSYRQIDHVTMTTLQSFLIHFLDFIP